MFRREGDYWTLSYDGLTTRIRDSKGMRYLEHLLKHAHREVDSWQLLSVARREVPVAQQPRQEDIERARVSVTKSIKAALLRIRDHNGALADHLQVTIRRGYTCTYRPDPRVPIRWV